ncbi:MAG: DUF971 domain-containing protein, partial [Myxococcales bacterium]|nr:DUF971 domain-containing protein [Myxococcales bacterium]
LGPVGEAWHIIIPVNEAKPKPVEVKNDRDNGRMLIKWDDDSRTQYPYDTLHNACPSATCIGHGGEQEPPNLKGMQLLHIEEVGGYALRFKWNEGGCEDGIYSWDYLREIGQKVIA